MLYFLKKQRNIRQIYLLAILVISVLICIFIFRQEVQLIKYNFVYRLSTTNQGSTLLSDSDWSIRKPLGVEMSDSWYALPNLTLPPFSSDEVVISLEGLQIYPHVADELLLQFRHPEIIPKFLEGAALTINDLINWTHTQISYTGIQAQPLNIHQLLKFKKGDCTEFTLLAYYKLLAQGERKVIPVEGFRIPPGESRAITSVNFHAWLLVYLNNEWMIVDPLLKKISKPSPEYIVLNLMREGKSMPLVQGSNFKIKLK